MKFSPLIEFKNLQQDGIYSLAKVQWWLLKHQQLYNSLKKNWFCTNKGCYHRVIKHCSCENKLDEQLFLELFSKLDDFTSYCKRESFAKKELLHYKSIENDKALVKEWVKSNEKIGADECFMFLIEHLDYNNNPIHLLVTHKLLLGFDVFVDRNDFKNLIEYLEVFSDLFWVKEVYPESEILNRYEKGKNE